MTHPIMVYDSFPSLVETREALLSNVGKVNAMHLQNSVFLHSRVFFSTFMVTEIAAALPTI